MNRFTTYVILLVILSLTSWVISFQNFENISKNFSYVAGASTLLSLTSIFHNIQSRKSKNEKIRNEEILPTVAPLTTILEISKNYTEKQIRDITNPIDGNLEKIIEFNSMIVLISSRFCDLLKIELNYRIPYALALSYKLVEAKKNRFGKSYQEIEHVITNFKKIRCGKDTWELTDKDIETYHKFTALDNLILLNFKEAKDKSVNIDPKQSKEDKKIIYDEAKLVHNYIQKNEPKLKKLLSILHDDVSLPDFFKILASLETDIVLISEQGISDPDERKSGSGKKYVDQVLEKRGLKLGKLNNAVSIAFLNDITNGMNPIFFDLNLWGKQVETEANSLRIEDEGDERKFSFVMLRTSIHELYAFGDELGNRSRIRIDSNTLSKLQPKDTTISSIATMSKILRETQKLSLKDFIDKHLEYLDGIYNKEIASVIAKTLESKHGINQWRISDFVNCSVSKEDFKGIDISDDQIDKILTESKQLVEALKQ